MRNKSERSAHKPAALAFKGAPVTEFWSLNVDTHFQIGSFIHINTHN